MRARITGLLVLGLLATSCQPLSPPVIPCDGACGRDEYCCFGVCQSMGTLCGDAGGSDAGIGRDAPAVELDTGADAGRDAPVSSDTPLAMDGWSSRDTGPRPDAPRPDAGPRPDTGPPPDLTVIDGVSIRGAPLSASSLGTYAVGTGRLSRVLADGVIAMEGTQCDTFQAPCAARFIGDDGVTRQIWPNASEPVVSAIDPTHAFLVQGGASMRCGAPFPAWHRFGMGTRVDLATGRRLETVASNLDAIATFAGAPWLVTSPSPSCTVSGDPPPSVRAIAPPFAMASDALAEALLGRADTTPEGEWGFIRRESELGLFAPTTGVYTRVDAVRRLTSIVSHLDPATDASEPGVLLTIDEETLGDRPILRRYDTASRALLDEYSPPSAGRFLRAIGASPRWWFFLLTDGPLLHDVTGEVADLRLPVLGFDLARVGPDTFVFVGTDLRLWRLDAVTGARTEVPVTVDLDTLRFSPMQGGVLVRDAALLMHFVDEGSAVALGIRGTTVATRAGDNDGERPYGSGSSRRALIQHRDGLDLALELWDSERRTLTLLTRHLLATIPSPETEQGCSAPYFLSLPLDAPAYVAFSELDELDPTRATMFVAPADGSAPARAVGSYTAGMGECRPPLLSPDVRRIGFMSGPRTGATIVVAPLD